MQSKREMRQLYKASANAIREILLEFWDPINIGDQPNFADEYDSFIPKILQSLRKSPNDEVLFDLLAGIEEELSATIPDDQRRRTVKGLLNLRLDSKQRNLSLLQRADFPSTHNRNPS
jgi:hypothetical protein